MVIPVAPEAVMKVTTTLEDTLVEAAAQTMVATAEAVAVTLEDTAEAVAVTLVDILPKAAVFHMVTSELVHIEPST